MTTGSHALSELKPHWLPVCANGGGDAAGGGRGGKVSGTPPRPPPPRPLSPPGSEAAVAGTCLAERSG